MPDPSDMPASFRAKLDAALARPLLLDPRSLDAVHAAGGFKPRADAGGASSSGETPYARQGDVAIVSVDGPLAQRAWSCWMFEGDGYDAIAARVSAALADTAVRAVVLKLDSPGGEVAGCFEAVRAIRAARASADKHIVAYVDEMACSAAYALACACDGIVCPDSGVVGSIGVITAVTDETAAHEAGGRRVRVFTTGEAKADGHPAVPLTDAAAARIQADIDGLAQLFAAEVAASRPIDAKEALALGARVFRGDAARAAGLVDRVGNLGDALALARALEDRRAPRASASVPARRATGSRAASTTAGRAPAPGAHRMNSILALLGLPESATEHEAAAAVTKALGAERQVVALTGAPSFDAALGTIHGWKAEAAKTAALAQELAAVRAVETARERAAVLDGLVSSGRMAPAERAEYESDPALAALPLAALHAMARTRTAAAPAVKTAPVVNQGGPAAPAFTPEDAEVARMMGRDPKKVAAHAAATEVE